MEFEIITVMERSLLAEGQVTAVRMDRQSSRSRPPPAIREGLRELRRIVTVWITSKSRNQ
jgi:acyl-CoA thioesterase FadM